VTVKEYGILFDVDGVVADSETVNITATQRAFAQELRIQDVQAEDFHDGIGRGAHEYVRAGARARGRSLTDEEVEAVVDARQRNFLAILEAEPLPAFPGVLELMREALANEDMCVAIATSSTRKKSQAVLQAAGVPYERMVYVCGDDVTKKKPDPEVFSLTCQRLNMAPERCVVLEDAPNGVQAAHAAGCRCIAITNTHESEALIEADQVVESLVDVDLTTIRDLITQAL
jgi:HAD superfamily hydrolase (TIGR01509 family)